MFADGSLRKVAICGAKMIAIAVRITAANPILLIIR